MYGIGSGRNQGKKIKIPTINQTALEKQKVIKKEKQSRGKLRECSITMKLCRHLTTAHIRTAAGFVGFYLYLPGF